MNYTINTGLLKEESLSAKIYFLLFQPKTQSELSKILYSGKIQLANIRKNLEELEKEGYVKNIGREKGKGKNFNQIYYKSTFKPLFEFITKEVNCRIKSSKSTKKEGINEKDFKFLEDFLNSNWFSYFYSQEYLQYNKECMKIGNQILCSRPIRFFAFLLEEIFVIRQVFERLRFLFEDKKIKYLDFDNHVKEKLKIITPNRRKIINNVLKSAKKYLGNYDSTNKVMDIYFRNYGILAIPYDSAKKMSSLGRIPLTIFNCFNMGIEDELDKLLKKITAPSHQ